jgi:hypothetical protein
MLNISNNHVLNNDFFLASQEWLAASIDLRAISRQSPNRVRITSSRIWLVWPLHNVVPHPEEMIEFTLSRDDEGQLIQTNQMKNALWTLEDNVERSQTDGPNVAVECGLRLAFDESNIVLWWLRLPLRNHDMPWLKYSPNRHILRLESNGRKCKTKKKSISNLLLASTL